MVLNDKLYYRYEEIKPAPFAEINKETLKVVKNEIKFEE